jgi:hypothetical protein
MPFTLKFDPERSAAVVGFVFGLATLAAGGGVLLGRDPGYIVYRPLLLFNTAMGFAYVYAAWQAWMRSTVGRTAAGAVFAANAAMLLWIVYQFRTRAEVVAMDSVRAITLRTVVWLVLWAVLAWGWRRKQAS